MRFISVLFLLAMFAAGSARAELVHLQSRPGVTLPVLIEAPSGPAAAWVLLYVGGDGMLRLNAQGAPTSNLGQVYIVRDRRHLTAAGLGVVVVDMPSDRSSSAAPAYRLSNEHVTDIGFVVRTIRERFGRPVWIMGHSNGTFTTATAVRRLTGSERPDGAIFSSSTLIQARKSRGLSVEPFPYNGPVLIVVHELDACDLSPPADGQNLYELFPNARPRALRKFTGMSPTRGGVCEGNSTHSFYGLEADVMRVIAAFVRNPK
ncbi:MAG: alpha/beta hydrolase [Alphaproteobacteria bacterium]